MLRLDTVAIIGVGLIGGSLGKALLERKIAKKVIGIGRRQESLRVARRVGAVTNTTINLEKGVEEASLVVVASPVAQVVELVHAAAEFAPKGATIIDVASTKAEIVEALSVELPRDCGFLGCHPLAGREKSGASFADAELFDEAMAIVTPTSTTRTGDYVLAEKLWEAVGSVIIKMTPEEHDKTMAMVSHLPHLAASALMAVVPESLLRFAGTGLRDTTRLAAGDVELWKQICADNRINIIDAIEMFGAKLADLRNALRNKDDETLQETLTLGKKNRDALGS